MHKTTERLEDVAMMHIEGELTIFSASEVAGAIKESMIEPLAMAKDIALDLSQVTEIDAAGLQILLMSKRAAERHGAKISFINCNAAVQELLALSNTQAFLQVEAA